MATSRQAGHEPAPRRRRAAKSSTRPPAAEASTGPAPVNRGRKLPPEVLTADEVRALIKACGSSTTGQRNAAIIAVMWGGGLRTSEALGLMPADYNPAHGTLRVVNGKGGRGRTVTLNHEAQAHLDRWCERRAALGLNGRHGLFPIITKGPTWGKPLPVETDAAGHRHGSPYIRRMLKRMAERAGIDRRVHPHGLRASLASELAYGGAPLPVISEQLGHANLATTSGYIRKVAPADLARELRGFEFGGARPPEPSAPAEDAEAAELARLLRASPEALALVRRLIEQVKPKP